MRVAAGTRVFDPALFLTQRELPSGATSPDLLILNQPISDFDVFSRLWKASKYRLCADGGANRLFDMFEGELKTYRAQYVSVALTLCKANCLLIAISCQMLFMETSIHCVRMYAPTMLPMALKCLKTLTSTALILVKQWRKSPYGMQLHLRERSLCLELLLVE